jgi:hypothetical protein
VSAALWAAPFGMASYPVRQVHPARDLFARQAHGEAVARIGFCVVESALGVLTGERRRGKTVAPRADVFGLDPTRHAKEAGACVAGTSVRGARHRPADVAQTTWDKYASLPRQGPNTPA